MSSTRGSPEFSKSQGYSPEELLGFLNRIGVPIYRKTAAETAASVTPVDFSYPEGHVLRYGKNTTPGTTDTDTFWTAAFNLKRITNDPGTFLIGSGITIPIGERWVDAPLSTITQGSGANIATLVTHSGFGDDHGVIRMRLDGNRDNNTAVVGFHLNGTAARDRCEYDIAGRNCDTVMSITREVEHCRITAWGQECGVVLNLDTTTNTADENDYYVHGHQVDNLLTVTGAGGNSTGRISLFGEICDDFAAVLNNGVFSLQGEVRGCGVTSGGGIHVTGTTSKVHFGGLALLGADPAPNNGTWGFVV